MIIRLYTIIILITIALSLEAQITINSSDMPSAGDTITTSNAINTLGIDFQSTGENFLWDFSTLTPETKQGDTFKEMDQTPLAFRILFFDANLAIYEGSVDTLANIQITDIYQFLSNTNNSFQHLGAGINVNGIPLPMKFSSYDKLYEFPLDYNNTYNSVSNLETSLPGLGFYKTQKTRTNVVDGWGEVITPYGQFQTLRVKSDVIQYDSIYLDSLGMGIPSTRYFTEYKWLANGMGVPVIQFREEGLLVTATYIDSAETHQSVPEYVMQANFSVYPNPSNGLVYLKNNSANKKNHELFIYTINGQEILSKDLPAESNYSLNLKSYGIAKGVYFLVVRNNSEMIFREKLIVE